MPPFFFAIFGCLEIPKMEQNRNKRPDLQRLLAEHTERVKELMTINRTTTIISEGMPLPETLRQIALILPR